MKKIVAIIVTLCLLLGAMPTTSVRGDLQWRHSHRAGQPPQGGFGGQVPGGDIAASGAGISTFTMTSKVNSFSGVTDYSGVTAPAAPEMPNPVQPQPPAAAPGNFSDVDSGAWYRSAADYVSVNVDLKM